jgi:uncharacterized membrane protein
MQAAVSKLAWTIALLALAGIAVSSVSLAHHYADDSESSFCAVDETFNCDLVNKSIYARLFGVPVALIGMVGYAALLALAFVRSRWGRRLLALAALGGLGFALYLTYIEAFILGVYCLLCLTSLALIAAITVLSGRLLWRGAPATRDA